VRERTELGCRFDRDKERRNQCLRELPESVLSDSVEGFLHTGRRTGIPSEEATGYLFTVRDPLDRIISWYIHSHPANTQFISNATTSFDVTLVRSPFQEFYVDCFWDLNSYAEALIGPGDEDACSEVSRTVAQSRQVKDLFWDYRFYASKTIWKFPDTAVYAIRTEHLSEDFNNLNTLLGGAADRNITLEPEDEGSSNPNMPITNKSLSTKGMLGLCCSLRSEIEVYETILRRAKNVQDSDVIGHRCYDVLEANAVRCDA